VDRLIPEAEFVSSIQLDRLVVIERGESLVRELDPISAFETLSANTEDAYGFPPYPRIQDALVNGRLRDEQDIRRQVVSSLPAVLLRTPDRAWFELLPRLAAGLGLTPDSVLRLDDGGDVMLDLAGVGGAGVENGELIEMEPPQEAETIASRFAKLSPEEAEEVERALSGALSLLQRVSDILDGPSDREAVTGLLASVRSLRDARISQGKG
jgi:hypothetical protein